MQSVRPADPLRYPCLFVCLLVGASALNIIYNYVMYNVDMRLSFG